jgi:hypothetical protein
MFWNMAALTKFMESGPKCNPIRTTLLSKMKKLGIATPRLQSAGVGLG